MSSLLGALALLAVLSGAWCQEKMFLQRAGTAFTDRPFRSVLNVTNGERFGAWTWSEMCPQYFFAVGFSIRVERNQVGGDDTAVNGIRLICARQEDRSFQYSVESHTGYFGDWTPPRYCPSGVLISFQIRVEPHRGFFGDDTTVNNIKFRCSSYPALEAPGLMWGDYGAWSEECTEGGICGIQTKMEEYQGGAKDDTALNDVRFHCCDRYEQK